MIAPTDFQNSRRQKPLAQAAALVLLVAAAGCMLFIVLHAATGRTVDIGAAGDTRFSSGFFPPEVGEGATLRWSGTASELVLHGAGDGLHLLDMRFHGGQLATSSTNRLGLEHAGREVAALTVLPGWRVYHTLLSADVLSAPLGDAPRLLLSSATFPIITDKRNVGVALDWVRVTPVPERILSDTAALRRALYLTWLLALLTGLAWRVDRLTFPAGQPARAWRVALPVAAIAALLVWWCRSDPYLFAWLLPETPWAAGVVTLGLAGGVLQRGLVPVIAPLRRGNTRGTLWLSLGALAIAQSLFFAHTAVGLGIVIMLVGLALVLKDPTWARRDPTRATHYVGTRAPTTPTRVGSLTLPLIVLVALALRFYRIDALPYGLWRDEAAHGLVALHMLEQPDYRPVYVPDVDLPGLGLYPFALALKLWGVHPWSMRPVTAIAGALTTIPLYGLVYRLSGRPGPALLAAALLAVSSWSLSISRLSFPHIFDPLLTLTGLWLMLVGFQSLERRTERRSQPVFWGAMLLGGLCLGLALHTYHTGRIAPLMGAMLALCWLASRPRLWRRWLAGMLLLAIGYLAATWPLLRYAMEQPAFFNGRVNEVWLLSETALKGRAPLAVLDQALGRHLLMFNVRGDSNGRHHAPGRPMLDWLTGLGFLVGAAAVIRGWRDWRSLFLLGALGIGVVPSMLAVDAPHALRSFDAAAFAMVIAALGWAEIWQRVTPALHDSTASSVWSGHALRSSTSGGLLLVMLALGLNARTYFVVMPRTPAVWQAFYPVQTKIGAYLRQVAEDQGGQALDHVYLKETIAEHSVTTYLLHGFQTQTFDGTSVSSPPAADAVLVLSGLSYQADRATLAAYVGPDPRPVLLGPLLPDGKTPSFVVYGRR